MRCASRKYKNLYLNRTNFIVETGLDFIAIRLELQRLYGMGCQPDRFPLVTTKFYFLGPKLSGLDEPANASPQRG